VRRVDGKGVITTVAGNGRHGYSGDGGPATKARLSDPYGLAFDAKGNLYVADNGNGRIRRGGHSRRSAAVDISRVLPTEGEEAEAL
jgi:DNA-binding beta-propeller fold protein YncE